MSIVTILCLVLSVYVCNGQPTTGQGWPGQGQQGQMGQLGFGGGYGGGPMAFGGQNDPFMARSYGIQGQDPWLQQRAMMMGANNQGGQQPPTGQPPSGMAADQLMGRSLVVLGAAPGAPPVGQVQDGSNTMPGSAPVGVAAVAPPWAMNGGAGPFVGSGQMGLGAFVPPKQEFAMAVLSGNTQVRGVLFLTQNALNVTITGQINGLAPGAHGLHIHEFGDTSNGCMNAGDHFNPMNRTHGGPNDAPNRHVGDLGNIVADSTGAATVLISDNMITLMPSPGMVLGKAIVVHEKPDDLGKGNDAQSRVDGNTGARLACGVIVSSAPHR